MADIYRSINEDHVELKSNGNYRVIFPVKDWADEFAVVFAGEGSPAGTMALSFNGNYGVVEAILDLSSNRNAVRSNMKLPYIDVEVTNLPAGSGITFYAR